MTSASAQNHIRVVSLLTLMGGVLGMLPGLLLLFVAGGLLSFGGFSSSPAETMFAGGIVGIVALFLFMIGLPAVIAGFGLLARKPWARTLTLIIAVFNLFGFPIGTMLGAYQLWVLAMNDETVAAFRNPPVPATRDYA
jgi:hypothetical protein